MIDAADPRAAALLRFWFADAFTNEHAARARNKVWFKADPRFDAELAQRFGDWPDRAAAGELDSWAVEPAGAAARILVLDQLPRNLYRGSPKAFAYDHTAVAAASRALDAGHDARMPALMAAFVYLPFEHAEDLALQEQAVACFETLQVRAPQPLQDLFASFTDYARRHRTIIARFGRFPHRNDVLGRPSTPEEVAYLADGAERFGVPPSPHP